MLKLFLLFLTISYLFFVFVCGADCLGLHDQNFIKKYRQIEANPHIIDGYESGKKILTLYKIEIYIGEKILSLAQHQAILLIIHLNELIWDLFHLIVTFFCEHHMLEVELFFPHLSHQLL